MERLTDWIKLWEELCHIQNKVFAGRKNNKKDDFWKHKAKEFDKIVDERWSKPDSSRAFLVEKLKETPGASLLDIGAGTGKWSLFASPHAAKITALDPSSAMQEVLKEKIQQQGITNIDVVTGSWPEYDAKSHDFVLASHSMYGVADFKGFVDKMSSTATKGCMMLMRATFADSVMAVAARKVLGQPYDSPNFQVAYNALMSMDIYPDVFMEQDGNWMPWTHDSFEDAVKELKERLDVSDTSEYDRFFFDLLSKNLVKKDGKFVWPVGTRSGLIYWEV